MSRGEGDYLAAAAALHGAEIIAVAIVAHRLVVVRVHLLSECTQALVVGHTCFFTAARCMCVLVSLRAQAPPVRRNVMNTST